MIEYSYDPPYNHWSGNRSDTLNKWKINYKGSIATASALPEKGDFKGDTYNVLEDGSNYMWNGSSWDKLDANVYVGSTATANGIRGLVPPATTAQMYSLLTGSGVWKSGVELGFAYDNAVVHLTGDEVVNGQKTFTTSPITLKNNNIDYTENSISSSQYTTYNFKDVNNVDLGGMQLVRRDTGGVDNKIYCKNLDGSAECDLMCGFDSSGNKFALAPSTDSNRDYGLDILTRDWIPKDDRIVHTTGNERIRGSKNFLETYIGIANEGMKINEIPTNSLFQTLAFRDADNNLTGRLLLYHNGSSNNNSHRGLTLDLSKKASSVDGAVIISGDLDPSTNNYVVGIGGSGCTAFYPKVAGITLGSNSTTYRWGQIYSSSTTIQTSDERVKCDVSVVPNEILDAWADVNWVQFKMVDAVEKKGSSARLHNGMIAQHIDTVFKNHNLDISDYGLFCYDEWEKEEPTFDDNNHEIYHGQEAGNLYSLRYEEALCMEAAYQRRRAERAEARIKALEDRLEALEAKLA